jgi:hypothetical protein
MAWRSKLLAPLAVAGALTVLGTLSFAQTPHDCGSQIQTIEWLQRRGQGLPVLQRLNALEKAAGTFTALESLSGLTVPEDLSFNSEERPASLTTSSR